MTDIKQISIDEAQTILSIIGEEESIGLEEDQKVQDAIETIQTRIEELIREGKVRRDQILLSYSSK